MDKSARAQLLRERLKAIAGPFAFKPDGKKRKARYVPRRTAFRFVYPMGFTGGPGFVGKWVVKPDAKEDVPKLKTKRTEKPSPITKIAEQVHPQKLKLKRRHATAEGLLSERARQSRP